MHMTKINKITICGISIEDVDVYAYETRLWIGVNSLAERLGMKPRVERKIVRDDPRHGAQVIPGIGKDGKNRKILAIPYAKLPVWLFLLNTGRVMDDEIRPDILDAQHRLNKSFNDLLKSVALIQQVNGITNESLLELTHQLIIRK